LETKVGNCNGGLVGNREKNQHRLLIHNEFRFVKFWIGKDEWGNDGCHTIFLPITSASAVFSPNCCAPHEKKKTNMSRLTSVVGSLKFSLVFRDNVSSFGHLRKVHVEQKANRLKIIEQKSSAGLGREEVRECDHLGFIWS